MIALYAIIDHPGPPLPEGMSLGLVARQDLAAVWAPADTVGEVTAETLWRHERVVEALMDDRDVLPVRYGTCLPDEAAVAAFLEARHDELVTLLGNIRGAVEVSVRTLATDTAPSAPETTRPNTGTEYLRARRRQGDAQDDAARVAHDPLTAVARAQRRRPPTQPDELVRAAYLIDRSAVESFSALVAELQRHNPALRLICTGPWPPYSFAQS